MHENMANDPGKMAEERFGHGFNCAQAVFTAFAGHYGLDDAAALKLVSPFGGGVARRGEVCGAVTGGLLVLGLARGASTPEGKEEIYRLAQEFLQEFEAGHQTILCRDLIGYDISQPESHQQARAAGVFKSVCPCLVRDAAEIIHAMLQASSK
jgi:C_GCAxxG_C_C family probable redox protein